MTANNESRPSRVLFVARAPFVSGAERALVSMLRHLDRNRVEPALILGSHTELVEIAHDLGVPVTVQALPKRSIQHPFTWRRSLRALGRVIDDFCPDIIHANDVPSCQAMSVAAGRSGVPRVIHIRWGITAQDAAWWARDGAECVLCISQWVRDELGDVGDTSLADSRIEVLPDSVDWPADPDHAVAPRASDRVEPDEPVTIGFAGQLIESKGLDLVIEAMGRLPAERRPNLIVAGDDTQTGGVYRKRLEDLAERCGVANNIEWAGFVDDISTVYKRIDAAVCPSRVEPLGLVPLEVSRFALPTVANRLGGFTETIEDGTTGYLVEPTIDGWVQGLTRLADRQAIARLGVAAHDRTARLYSPSVYQDRLLAVYEQLLSNPHPISSDASRVSQARAARTP